jgi:hypothetical protein
MKRMKQFVVVLVMAAMMLTSQAAFAVPTSLTVQALKENNYPVIAGDLAFTLTACDNVNGNSFKATGKEILIVQNSDGAAPHTFSVTSVVDPFGRLDSSLTGYSVPLNGFAVINVNTLAGWRQADGTVQLACNNALIKFAVVQLQH